MPDKLECHVLNTGYCPVLERILVRSGRWRWIRCPVPVVLFRHPRHGWFLLDTGFAPRLREVTRRFPFCAYRWFTRPTFAPEQTVIEQLNRFGLTPRDIRLVVLSHFHADHLAGLRDFPSSEILVSRTGYDAVFRLAPQEGLQVAFFPALLPADFLKRARFLDRFDGPDLDGLGPTHDLFGDQSALIVPLPGHARGHLGLFAQTEQGPLFFIVDSCWLSASYRENTPPDRFVHIIVDNPKEMRDTLARLHRFHQRHPNVPLIPSHCPDAIGRLEGRRELR